MHYKTIFIQINTHNKGVKDQPGTFLTKLKSISLDSQTVDVEDEPTKLADQPISEVDNKIEPVEKQIEPEVEPEDDVKDAWDADSSEEDSEEASAVSGLYINYFI